MIIKLNHEEVKTAMKSGLGKLFREPINVLGVTSASPYGGNNLADGLCVTIETVALKPVPTYRREPNVD